MKSSKLKPNSNKILIVPVNNYNIKNINKIKELDYVDYILLISNIHYENDFNIFDNIKNIVNDKVIFVIGKNELNLLKASKNNNTLAIQSEWIKNQSMIVSVEFLNSTKLIVINGGIENHHKDWDSLSSDIRLCYVKNDWHEFYDGKFGYAINLSENEEKEITHYGYSSSLCFNKKSLIVQEFGDFGIGKTINISL